MNRKRVNNIQEIFACHRRFAFENIYSHLYHLTQKIRYIGYNQDISKMKQKLQYKLLNKITITINTSSNKIPG